MDFESINKRINTKYDDDLWYRVYENIKIGNKGTGGPYQGQRLVHIYCGHCLLASYNHLKVAITKHKKLENYYCSKCNSSENIYMEGWSYPDGDSPCTFELYGKCAGSNYRTIDKMYELGIRSFASDQKWLKYNNDEYGYMKPEKLLPRDKYFKDPKYFYHIFDENTWLEKKELSSKLYFHHFRETTNKGGLDERLISDKRSFQFFLNKNKIIGACPSDDPPGSFLRFFFPIKILRIFDDYLDIKFGKPKFIRQNFSYADHIQPENWRMFLQEPSPLDLQNRNGQFDLLDWQEVPQRQDDGDGSRWLKRTDLSFSILSVHKSRSIALTEIEQSFKERYVIEDAIGYKREKVLLQDKYINLSLVEKLSIQDSDLEEFQKQVREGYVPIHELAGVRFTRYVLPNDKDLEKLHTKSAEDFYNASK